jgi:PBSX family phage terminase large subunit
MAVTLVPVTEHIYRPRGACSAVFRRRDPEVLVAGPAGTGKSRACLEKMNFMSLLNPGMRGLICRKTASSLSSTALVTWTKFVIPEGIKNGDVHYYGGSAQEPPSYRYRNGSVVAIGGLDKVDKIMSSEYDLVYVQEATELTENDWEAITTRLRNWKVSFQQLLADCNPSAPTHWLKKRCEDGRTVMIESRHEDNPQLFDENGMLTEQGRSYLEKLDRLSGVRYQRLRLGRWVAAEGVIFDEFADIHVIDKLPPAPREAKDEFGVPISWRRFWSIDFGFNHPFVLQCWAEDYDGRLYLYREIYMTRRTVDEHAKKIMSVVAPDTVWDSDGNIKSEGKWKEPKPHAVVCDHDAEGRVVFERATGLATSAAHKAVTEGIQAVQMRFKVQKDGHPRIFLLRDTLVEQDVELKELGKATCTLEEIPGYVWAGGKKDEEPLKENDDGCDAMRYVVAELDFGIRALYRTV